MNDNTFWVKFWAIIGFTIIGVAAIIALTIIHSRRIDAEMIEGVVARGADPVAVKCATLVGVNATTQLDAMLCAQYGKAK